MNYSNHSHRKLANQQGVVLITSLIFLILILLLVRFSLSESQLQERKSGIDTDIVFATEGAKMALRIAEADILNRHTAGFTLRNCAGLSGPVLARCQDAQQALQAKDTIDFWRDPANNNLNYVAYANALPCIPVWQCANWGNQFRGLSGTALNSAVVPDGNYINNLSLSAGQTAISPRYIIESIDPINQLELGTADPVTSDSVVLRVTTVGFGLDDGSGNVTNAMLQATYILKP